MSDLETNDPLEALQAFADEAPPPGDRHAIQEQALRSIGRRRTTRRVATAGGLAAATAAVLLIFTGNPAPTEPIVAQAMSVGNLLWNGQPAVDGAELREGTFAVSGGSARVLLRSSPRTTVELKDGSRGELTSEFVRLDQGTARIEGEVRIEGCGCEAAIEGTVEVTAADEYLSVVIIAGTVERFSSDVTCRVLELSAPVATAEPPAEPDMAPEETPSADSTGPTPDSTEPVVAARNEPTRDRCDLAAQTEAYRAAIAQRGNNDGAMIRDLKGLQRRYRGCSLAHEVDVALVEALLRTGRSSQASREASRFLRRYPRSSRRDEMSRIATMAQ